LAVSGVTEELVVPDPDSMFRIGVPFREDRLRWSDPAAVGCRAKVLDAGVENRIGVFKRAGVDHVKGPPMKTADAAHRLTPRLACGIGEIECFWAAPIAGGIPGFLRCHPSGVIDAGVDLGTNASVTSMSQLGWDRCASRVLPH